MNLAVVILNYNGAHYLEQFLPTVIQFSPEAEIIVADNASTDHSLEVMSTQFPAIKCIKLQKNGGFAAGYNEALQHVSNEFYLLLNSDIEVTAGWLQPLMERMKDPKVAGCQPKVLSYHDKTKFEHAGAAGGFLDKDYYPFCRGRIFDLTETDQGQYDDAIDIFWATGASLLIRSSIFHEAGGFDADFFAHMEEIDLCWRVQKMGYKFQVEPNSVVYHVGGGTLSYQSPFKTYLNFRNSLFMLIKNHDGLLFPKWIRRMFLDAFAGARFIAKREFKQLKALFNAHIDMYQSLPKMLRKRRDLKKGPQHPVTIGIHPKSILWLRFVQNKKHYSEIQ